MSCVSNMESNESRYQVRIAQLAEHRVEATGVAGSIPAPTRVSNPHDRCNDHLTGPRGVSSYPPGFNRAFSRIGWPECKSGF